MAANRLAKLLIPNGSFLMANLIGNFRNIIVPFAKSLSNWPGVLFSPMPPRTRR